MLEIVCGIIMIVAAVFLVVAVLLQDGKSYGLSGAIAGGAETFFGKSKSKTLDKTLSILTIIVAVIFVVLVMLVYIFQSKTLDTDSAINNAIDNIGSQSSEGATGSEDALSAVEEQAGQAGQADQADQAGQDGQVIQVGEPAQTALVNPAGEEQPIAAG